MFKGSAGEKSKCSYSEAGILGKDHSISNDIKTGERLLCSETMRSSGWLKQQLHGGAEKAGE